MTFQVAPLSHLFFNHTHNHMKKITLTLCVLVTYLATFAQIDELEFRQMLSEINADSIRATVQEMVDIPNRFAATSNYDVADYIVQRLHNYGISNAHIDSFPVNEYSWLVQGFVNHNLYNTIGSLTGSEYPDSIVIIGAHHDCLTTNPPYYNYLYLETAGADDNASGCAVLLEIARIFHKHNFTPRYSIDFMTYDGEEFGLWGSNHDAIIRAANGDNIVLMLNNDMVANDPNDDRRVTLHWYPNALDQLNTAVTMCDTFTEISAVIPSGSDNDESQASDSYSYSLQGFPAVFAIENNFSPAYHEPGDTTGLYNYPYVAEVTKMNMAMLVHYTYHNVLDWGNVGLSTAHNNTLKLYPNPTTGIIHIQGNDGESITRIEISDICGHLLLLQSSNFSKGINLCSLQPGVYFAKAIYDNGDVSTQKIVKR